MRAWLLKSTAWTEVRVFALVSVPMKSPVLLSTTVPGLLVDFAAEVNYCDGTLDILNCDGTILCLDTINIESAVTGLN